MPSLCLSAQTLDGDPSCRAETNGFAVAEWKDNRTALQDHQIAGWGSL